MKIYHSIQDWQVYLTELIVLVDSEVIVGSVRVTNYPNDRESWIYSLYVDENHRRQGIAKLLLDEAESVCIYKPERVSLEDNAPSWLEEFYRRRGYEIVK